MKNRIKSKATTISPKSKIVDYNHVYPLLSSSRPPLPNQKDNTKSKYHQVKVDSCSKVSQKQTLTHSKHFSTHSHKNSHQDCRKLEIPSANTYSSKKSTNSNCLNLQSKSTQHIQKKSVVSRLDKAWIQQAQQIVKYYYHIRDVYQINQGLSLMSLHFVKKDHNAKRKTQNVNKKCARNNANDSQSFQQMYQDSGINQYNQMKAQLDLDVMYVESQDLGQIIDGEQAQASQIQQKTLVRSFFLKGEKQKYGCTTETQQFKSQYQQNGVVQGIIKQFTKPKRQQSQKGKQQQQKNDQSISLIARSEVQSNSKKNILSQGSHIPITFFVKQQGAKNIFQSDFTKKQLLDKQIHLKTSENEKQHKHQDAMSDSLQSQNFTDQQQFSQQNSFDQGQQRQVEPSNKQFISFDHFSQNFEFQGPQILATFGGSQESQMNTTGNKTFGYDNNDINCKGEKVILDLYLELEPQFHESPQKIDELHANQNVNTMNFRSKGAIVHQELNRKKGKGFYCLHQNNVSGISYAHKIEQDIKLALNNQSYKQRKKGHSPDLSKIKKNTKFLCVSNKQNRKQVVVHRISLDRRPKNNQKQQQLTNDKSYLEKVIRKTENS